MMVNPPFTEGEQAAVRALIAKANGHRSQDLIAAAKKMARAVPMTKAACNAFERETKYWEDCGR